MTVGIHQAPAREERGADASQQDRRRPRQPPADRRPLPALPIVPAATARPTWLLLGALAGLAAGVMVIGSPSFTATSTLQLTNLGQDSLRAKQVAQTAQRVITSASVIDQAARATRVPADDLGSRVVAQWQSDTELVTVSVTAADEESAVAQANAVATSAVRVHRSLVQARLNRLRDEADRLLNSQRVSNSAAEEARRAQLGSGLANRQDEVSAESDAIFVADPALSAAPAGLGRVTGGIAGLLGGTLLAALASVLLGARAMRVRGLHRLRSLLPGAAVVTSASAADVAGSFVESGVSCLAVVQVSGAQEEGLAFAMDVAALVRGHGRTVTVLDVSSLVTRQARYAALSHDARNNVDSVYSTDVLIAVVEWGGDATGMLLGQSNLRAALVVRRRRARLRPLVEALSSFERAEPVVVLAR